VLDRPRPRRDPGHRKGCAAREDAAPLHPAVSQALAGNLDKRGRTLRTPRQLDFDYTPNRGAKFGFIGHIPKTENGGAQYGFLLDYRYDKIELNFGLERAVWGEIKSNTAYDDRIYRGVHLKRGEVLFTDADLCTWAGMSADRNPRPLWKRDHARRFRRKLQNLGWIVEVRNEGTRGKVWKLVH